MTIKVVSEKTATSAYTLRFYKKIGHIGNIERNESGHRYYSDADLEQINFTQRWKSTGMPINDIIRYIELMGKGENIYSERLTILVQHRSRIEESIRNANEFLEIISFMIYFQETRRRHKNRNIDNENIICLHNVYLSGSNALSFFIKNYPARPWKVRHDNLKPRIALIDHLSLYSPQHNSPACLAKNAWHNSSFQYLYSTIKPFVIIISAYKRVSFVCIVAYAIFAFYKIPSY